MEASAGSSQLRRLLTLSRIPQIIIVLLTYADVETNAAHNPFNFQGFGISRCRIMYNGRYYSQKYVQLLLRTYICAL